MDEQVQIWTCDIPHIHNPNREECIKFFEGLKDHGSEDLELFKCEAIKTNIKFLWPIVRGYIWKRQFSWYIAYLSIYLVYALGLYDYEKSMFDKG